MQQRDCRPVTRPFIDDIEDMLTVTELLRRRSLCWRPVGVMRLVRSRLGR